MGESNLVNWIQQRCCNYLKKFEHNVIKFVRINLGEVDRMTYGLHPFDQEEFASELNVDLF